MKAARVNSRSSRTSLRACAAPWYGFARVVLVVAAVAPSRADAWGFAAHRWIATRAADLVAERCPALVAGHAEELAALALEPDTELRTRLGRVEEVRHFLDLDHYGPPPFPALPRDYEKAVRRFGRERLHEQGILPWHAGSLARTLAREIERGAWDDARTTAGHLAHYAGDATVPLHATENHDGQRTGQNGLHRRLEAKLVDYRLAAYGARAARTGRRAAIPPQRAEAAMFATLEQSYALLARVLAADREARYGTRVGSAVYYRRLDADLREPLAKRLGAAAALTAALWEGACEAATRRRPAR